MADLLRQLRNDEKRYRFAHVVTVRGEDLDGTEITPTDIMLFPNIQGNSFNYRVSAVVKEAFASGATCDFGTFDEATQTPDGVLLFDDLDLTVVGAKISDGGAIRKYMDKVKAMFAQFNQEAINSATGEVQFIFEIVEDSARDGSYTV